VLRKLDDLFNAHSHVACWCIRVDEVELLILKPGTSLALINAKAADWRWLTDCFHYRPLTEIEVVNDVTRIPTRTSTLIDLETSHVSYHLIKSHNIHPLMPSIQYVTRRETRITTRYKKTLWSPSRNNSLGTSQESMIHIAGFAEIGLCNTEDTMSPSYDEWMISQSVICFGDIVQFVAIQGMMQSCFLYLRFA